MLALYEWFDEPKECPAITCTLEDKTGDTVKIPKDQMKFIGDAILPAVDGFTVKDAETGVVETVSDLSCSNLRFWFYAIGDEMYPTMKFNKFWQKQDNMRDIYLQYWIRCP